MFIQSGKKKRLKFAEATSGPQGAQNHPQMARSDPNTQRIPVLEAKPAMVQTYSLTESAQNQVCILVSSCSTICAENAENGTESVFS